jgi:hypothetical protein
VAAKVAYIARQSCGHANKRQGRWSLEFKVGRLMKVLRHKYMIAVL